MTTTQVVQQDALKLVAALEQAIDQRVSTTIDYVFHAGRPEHVPEGRCEHEACAAHCAAIRRTRSAVDALRESLRESARGGMVRGAEVRFDEGDGVHTDSLGVVTRVWPNRKYVTLRCDGRTFTRRIERVTPCV